MEVPHDVVVTQLRQVPIVRCQHDQRRAAQQVPQHRHTRRRLVLRVCPPKRLIDQTQQHPRSLRREDHPPQVPDFRQEVALIIGQIVARPQIGHQAQRRPGHLTRHSHRPDLCQEHICAGHPQKRALARHVRAGDDPHAAAERQFYIVWHNPLG